MPIQNFKGAESSSPLGVQHALGLASSRLTGEESKDRARKKASL